MGVEIKEVSQFFRSSRGTEVHALDDVSLSVAAGEIVCIVGESGCGKSTLLNIVAGLIRPSRGSVRVVNEGGTDGKVGYVFQEPRLLDWRTVEQNVRIALDSLKLSDEDKGERPKEYLELVGLSDFTNAFPTTLSGGMQQRVSLARGLVTHPDVLLMDEPFGSLDEFTARDLRTECARLVARQNQSVLFVTHNVEEAVYLADRIAVMSPRPGRLVDLIEVPLERPRDYEAEEFGNLRRTVMESLHQIRRAGSAVS